MVHIPPVKHHRRQAGDLEGTKTITGLATGTSLAFDTEATNKGGAGGAKFSLSTEMIRATITPTPTPEPTAVSVDSQSSASSHQIPIGTVVGACVGAFVGALILIAIGFFMYKKADPKRNKRGTQRDAGGRPAKSWNKLEEDTWEGKTGGNGGQQPKSLEMLEAPPHPPNSAEMQKDSIDKMFKRSPSVRTEYTIKTDLDHMQEPFSFNFGSHPFAQYHPNLAKELASTPASDTAQPRPAYANLERAQSGGVTSAAHDSFISMNSGKRVSGSMSPSVDMAIPTPPTISSGHPHHWESAEVLNFEGEAAEIVNPPPPAVIANDKSFNNPFVDRRKSENNPFFNATSNLGTMPASRSPSTKGKKREITPPTDAEENPFEEPQMSHAKVDSISSVSSNDRAIQSLLAALDGSAPSMDSRHPSMQSAISAYSQEDVTGSFPSPPTN